MEKAGCVRLLAALSSALAIAAGGASGQDLTTVVADVDQAMGRIFVTGADYEASGSGFVFSHDASGRPIFLTNFHVTAEGGEITVVFLAGSNDVVAFDGTLLASSPAMDMAALALTARDGADFRPREIPLALREIEKGEQVIARGYPASSAQGLGSDLHVALCETTLTQGLVSKVFVAPWETQTRNGSDVSVEIIQHTAAINHGNSGGPLLDECGHVLGMNTAGVLEDNVFLASSSRSLAVFLDDAGISYAGTTAKCGGVEAVAPPKPTPEPSPQPEAKAPTASPPPSPAADRTGWVALLAVLASVAAVVGIGAFVVSKSGRSASDDPLIISTPPNTTALLVQASAQGVTVLTKPLTRDALTRGVVIGRSAEADVMVDVAGVSRQHLRLELVQRQLLLTELGSTNGTTVDGQPLKPGRAHQINSQSRITLGGVVDLTLRRA